MSSYFFIDKTHTDTNGRLKLEPVMFTLGIFKRKCRANPMFWRTLGFITDVLDNTKPNKDKPEKEQDYHNMLNIVLKSFKQAQKTPVVWKFCENGQMVEKNCFFPVLFIIGDTEGHDKLCGRFLNRNNIQRLCRYCDCKFDKTDDPFVIYKYTKKKDVDKLIGQGNKKN